MHGISNIQASFNLKKNFVAYLTAGDGGIKKTLAAALALITADIDILEIGVPFSDPIADGPVIQRAAMRALDNGTTLEDILWLVKEIRKISNLPLILFSYLNPLLIKSSSGFLKIAAQAGIDGILIVDCPPEELEILHTECLENNIAPIMVISPSTSLQRIEEIGKFARGFLYYACRKGTTGIKTGLPKDFAAQISKIKSKLDLPIVAGFGIATREDSQQVLAHADGVVVGSLFVKALEDQFTMEELIKLAKNINPLV